MATYFQKYYLSIFFFKKVIGISDIHILPLGKCNLAEELEVMSVVAEESEACRHAPNFRMTEDLDVMEIAIAVKEASVRTQQWQMGWTQRAAALLPTLQQRRSWMLQVQWKRSPR